jgi:hypothetical protein
MNSSVLAFSEQRDIGQSISRAWAKMTTIRSLAQGCAKGLCSTRNVDRLEQRLTNRGVKPEFCVHPPSLVLVRDEELPITRFRIAVALMEHFPS